VGSGGIWWWNHLIPPDPRNWWDLWWNHLIPRTSPNFHVWQYIGGSLWNQRNSIVEYLEERIEVWNEVEEEGCAKTEPASVGRQNVVTGRSARQIPSAQQNKIPAAIEDEIYQKVRMNKLSIALSGKSLADLDLSGIGFGAEGAPLVAQYISGNRTLSKLDTSRNGLYAEGTKLLVEALSGNQITTKLNISGNGMAKASKSSSSDISRVIALAGVIPGMRAVSSLRVGSNGIPEKEMRKIMAIAMSKESMKILREVPFKNKTITELDVSGKNLGVEGALVIAEYLDGNGAMLSLNLTGNQLCAKGAKIVAKAITVTAVHVLILHASNLRFLGCCCLLLSTRGWGSYHALICLTQDCLQGGWSCSGRDAASKFCAEGAECLSQPRCIRG
jgi:hypothetical protein